MESCNHMHNWMGPEHQMMKKFTSYQNFLAATETSTWSIEFSELVSETIFQMVQGSLNHTMVEGYEKSLTPWKH